MNISEAAKHSGLSTTMIRRYEKLGLIKPAGRTDSGYRQYSVRDIEQLTFIQHTRAPDSSETPVRKTREAQHND